MNDNYQDKRENLCPRCRAGQLKAWRELSDDEKILAEKMPISADYSSNERKRHLFCSKCWHETIDETNRVA